MRRHPFLPVLLVIVGGLALARNVLPDFRSILRTGPIVLIVLGLWRLLEYARSGDSQAHRK